MLFKIISSNFLNNAKKLLQDYKFIYKLLSFFVLFISFVIGIIYGVFVEYWYVSPQNHVNIPRTYNLNVMISFWSVQTNALVMSYFFFSLLYHGKEQKYKITSFFTLLNVTIYITLTMLLFWILIFYGLGTKAIGKFHFSSKMNEIITIITHAVTPLLALGYLFLSLGTFRIDIKQYIIKKLFVTLIFPILYLIFVNLRAVLLIADGITSKSDNYLFPYPFIDFCDPIFPLPRVINNLLIISIGIVTIAILSLLVIIINNFINKKFVSIKKIKFLNEELNVKVNDTNENNFVLT